MSLDFQPRPRGKCWAGTNETATFGILKIHSNREPGWEWSPRDEYGTGLRRSAMPLSLLVLAEVPMSFGSRALAPLPAPTVALHFSPSLRKQNSNIGRF
jgi:hypothetical protein